MNISTLKRLEQFTKRYDRIIELRASLQEMQDDSGRINLDVAETQATKLIVVGKYALKSTFEIGNTAALGLQFVDLIARREEINAKQLFDEIVK